MIKSNKISSESGRTMLETIAALGLLASVAAGTYTMIANVYSSFKIFRSRAQIREIVENVRKYYASSYDYSTLSIASAITNKLVPLDMISGTNIHLNTGAEINDLSQVAAGVKSFYVQIKSVLPTECTGLLDLFIGQVDLNKSAYLLLHDITHVTGNTKITYSWQGDKINCDVDLKTITEIELHFNCMSLGRNVSNCSKDNIIKAYYY